MRNLRLDQLKLLAAFGIVGVHAIYHTNALKYTAVYSIEWFFLMIVYTLLFSMMNIFVIISGYFLCDSHFRWKKVKSIILTTICYSVVIYILFCIRDVTEFSFFDFMDCLLSPITNQYWFISAYLLLYILSPYLNKMLSCLNEKNLRSLCLISFVVLSIIPSFLIFVPVQNLFDAQNGKGILWFLTIYILCFYYKKYRESYFCKINSYWFMIILIFNLMFLIGSWIVLNYISIVIGLDGDGATRLYFDSSIFVFGISASIFLLTQRLPVINLKYGKFITYLSGSSLGVYIIHEQPMVRKFLWGNVENIWINNEGSIIVNFFIVTVIVFFFCIGIDCIRRCGENLVSKYKKIYIDRIKG